MVWRFCGRNVQRRCVTPSERAVKCDGETRHGYWLIQSSIAPNCVSVFFVTHWLTCVIASHKSLTTEWEGGSHLLVCTALSKRYTWPQSPFYKRASRKTLRSINIFCHFFSTEQWQIPPILCCKRYSTMFGLWNKQWTFAPRLFFPFQEELVQEWSRRFDCFIHWIQCINSKDCNAQTDDKDNLHLSEKKLSHSHWPWCWLLLHCMSFWLRRSISATLKKTKH